MKDSQTGVPVKFLFYGKLVSDRHKPKDIAVYAVEGHMEQVLVRDKKEFDQRFNGK
jgi:hypothetical protein